MLVQSELYPNSFYKACTYQPTPGEKHSGLYSEGIKTDMESCTLEWRVMYAGEVWRWKCLFASFKVLYFIGISLSIRDSCVQLHGRIRPPFYCLLPAPVGNSKGGNVWEGKFKSLLVVQSLLCPYVSRHAYIYVWSVFPLISSTYHMDWVSGLNLSSPEKSRAQFLPWRGNPDHCSSGLCWVTLAFFSGESSIKLWLPAVPCILVVPHFPASAISSLPKSLSGLEN